MALEGGPIVVDEQTRWADILDAVNSSTYRELEDVRYVDVYRGKGIPAGSKSVTLSLCFRDEDGTLTHDSVDSFEKAIVESLTECVQAQLRSL